MKIIECANPDTNARAIILPCENLCATSSLRHTRQNRSPAQARSSAGLFSINAESARSPPEVWSVTEGGTAGAWPDEVPTACLIAIWASTIRARWRRPRAWMATHGRSRIGRASEIIELRWSAGVEAPFTGGVCNGMGYW